MYRLQRGAKQDGITVHSLLPVSCSVAVRCRGVVVSWLKFGVNCFLFPQHIPPFFSLPTALPLFEPSRATYCSSRPAPTLATYPPINARSLGSWAGGESNSGYQLPYKNKWVTCILFTTLVGYLSFLNCLPCLPACVVRDGVGNGLILS